ncbi:MAG: hypothetical protein ACTSQI_16750 [Candidatus Helarchaeota archaeon]
MLKNVIIFWTHGTMLYSHSYDVGGKDPNIVSGFLSAFTSFAKEIGEGEIRSIVMHNSLILMGIRQEICFTIFFDQDDDETQGKLILEDLISSFLAEYPKLDKRKPVELTAYIGFTKTLDRLALIKNVYEIIESTNVPRSIREIQDQYQEKFGTRIIQAVLQDAAEFLVEKDAVRKLKEGKLSRYRKKGELLKGWGQKVKG